MANKSKSKAKKQAKPKAQSNGFKPGDLVVYPAHGVGRIESIESREIGDALQEFYIMKILESNMVIMIPVKNLEAVGLRDVIAKKEIPRIYDIIQTPMEAGTTDNQTWNRRHKEYMDKIKTGSLHDVAEVFRDLFVLKLTKDLSFGERKLLDTSRNLLVREVSIAKGLEEAVVLSEIEALFPSVESTQHADG
ncbi:MAG: CarD family transcriptional regulator [Thermodesulfobacteriota bacterium]|nr:CarD family transcriptional regulator [Thermodesulfobacteriota bacterium]